MWDLLHVEKYHDGIIDINGNAHCVAELHSMGCDFTVMLVYGANREQVEERVKFVLEACREAHWKKIREHKMK